MKLDLRFNVFSALTAAALLFAVAPAQAQTDALVVGRGTYLSANQVDAATFTYVVRQHQDGSAEGFAFWSVSGTHMLIELTSAMNVGDAVAMAGPIRWLGGTPPAPEFGFVVGRTAYFAVKDLGSGADDRTTGISAVPPQFGNPTIQQIVAFGGGPPPAAFRPLLSGNIWIR